MTPAEELRAAAKLMRERAHAVDAPAWPGVPWAVTECSDEEAANCPCIVYQGEYKPFDESQVPLIQYVADAETVEHAEYIASMHPGVALPVADWLDESGAWFERDVAWESPEGPCCAEPAACGGHEPIWYHADCDGEVATDCHCFDKALTVARAYLGSGQ